MWQAMSPPPQISQSAPPQSGTQHHHHTTYTNHQSAPPAFGRSAPPGPRPTFSQSAPTGCFGGGGGGGGGGTHHTTTQNPDGSSNIYVHHMHDAPPPPPPQPQQPQMQMPQMMGIPYPMPTPAPMYAPYPYPPPPPSSYGCPYHHHQQQQQQQPKVVIIKQDEEKKPKEDKKNDKKKDNKPAEKTKAPKPPPQPQPFSKFSITSVITFFLGLVFGVACVVKTYDAEEMRSSGIDTSSSEEFTVARTVAMGTGAAATLCITIARLCSFYSGLRAKSKGTGSGHVCLGGFVIAGWIIFCLTFITNLIILIIAFDGNDPIYPEVVWAALIGSIISWMLMFGYSEISRRAYVV